jgi:plasmid stability protein
MHRTQIYLAPEQHQSLKQEAAKKGVSLAQLIREILTDYLKQNEGLEKPDKGIYMGLVGLGQSGLNDVSARHDDYLTEVLKNDHHG